MSEQLGRRARITFAAAGVLLIIVLGWPLPRPAAAIAALYAVSIAYVVAQVRASTEGASAFAAARAAIAFVLVMLVPVVFDPRTEDIFNVTKFTVLTLGAIALVTTVVLGWLRGEQLPRATDAISLAVVGLVLWTAGATALSPEPRLSLIGAAHSYDGLFAMVGLATLFLILVDRASPIDPRRLVRVLALSAGGVVVAYGLVQLHDRFAPGISWDWVRWGEASFRARGVWSTLGNPNQLAAFLAALLPLLAGLAIVERDRRLRMVLAFVGIGDVVLLAYSSSRGAWVAAAAGVVTFAALNRGRLSEIPARRALAVAAVVLFLGVGVFVVVGGRGAGGKPLLLFGGGSSASVRLDLWRASLEMAADRPVVGFGPDNFAAPFAARAPADSDPALVADDAHNIFLHRLATTGVPGLIIFVAVLGIAVVRASRARRRLDRQDDRAVLLGAAGAALVATLVAGAFDVERIAFSFTLWVVLGVLVRSARATEESPATSESAGSAPGWPPSAIAAAMAVSALALAVAWRATAPHRADVAYLVALNHETVTLAPAIDRGTRGRSLVTAAREFGRAAQTAPWEPTYLAAEALFHRRLAVAAADAEDSPQTQAVVVARLGHALELAAKAVELRSSDPELLMALAEILTEFVTVEPCDAPVNEALDLALEALVRADPRRASDAVVLALTAGHDEIAEDLAEDEALQSYFDDEQLANVRAVLDASDDSQTC